MQKTVALHSDFQGETFEDGGENLQGQHSRMESVNGVDMLVIYHFKDGLIHNDIDHPAIEYPLHFEYWNNGELVKVVDKNERVTEFWKDRKIVSVKKDPEEQ